MKKSQNEILKIKDVIKPVSDEENILEVICDLQRELYEYL